MFKPGRGDIVVLQETIFNKWFIALMLLVKVLRRPIFIFDFDDAVYTHHPLSTRICIFIADKVTVASHYLAQWEGVKKKPVFVLPNLVDWKFSAKYAIDYNYRDKVAVGWIGGGPENIDNLSLLVPVFEELARKKLSFKFRLIGALSSEKVYTIFNQIKGLDVEFVDKLDWGKTGIIQEANASFDIGVCPLVDNLGNKARCSLKVLDYMAVGLPVVVSAVGENKYFIENNKSGFLVQTPEEWVDSLERLIKSNELRAQIGTAAQERLKRQYSYQSYIDSYYNFITS